ncbi:hypothetical protein [Chromohalobacter sp.]|uniref:hypothetical protein n=1 Tax=Chromohalobacter sp. TaxID=50740 RepID=UPI003242B9D1
MDTDLVITFTQQQTHWLGLTANQWISFVAAIITFGIMIAALMQWRSNIKTHKQSHMPFLKSYVSHPDPERGKEGYLSLTNSGLGPALLQEINVLRNGENIEGSLQVTCENLVRHIGEQARIPLKVTRRFQYQLGHPIGRDETIYLVKFDIKGAGESDAVEEALRDQGIQLHVVYLDMFDQRHEILDPKPERSL